MNRLRLIGMVDAEKEITRHLSPTDFDDERYEGVFLYRREDDRPVVLFVSKDPDPIHWRIVDGASEFYFRSFSEATEFCKQRGYIFVKGGQNHEQAH